MIKKSLNSVGSSSRVTGAPIVHDPELVFGIVGPIGVDIDAVIDSLSKTLKEVGYKSLIIHLTQLIDDPRIKVKRDFSTYYNRYRSLIDYANAFRRLAKSAAAMAGVAVVKVRELRAAKSGTAMTPARGTAYIVRQFKRTEEIDLMRQVYGRKFIQVSVFGSSVDRRRVMMEKIRSFEASPKTDAECEAQAIDLIEIDHNQKDDINGQRIADVFHLGDVFVDGIDPTKADQTIRRFIKAFFGDTKASPDKDEYGLYIAAAASLRSADLSRQVGAAIFSKYGEIISIGCNEVPKAGGGTYWTDDQPPIFRDVEIGIDTNQRRKTEIIYDLVTRMSLEGLLAKRIARLGNPNEQVAELLSNPRLQDSQLMDIIEFGRMIHAEMLAISDAARLGRATKDATLYCTTFPCHLCAKHIVAAGIDRVVFLEPYPKSYAQELHSDSITFETDVAEKVVFQPFMGISPRRYRDIFEKRSPRKENGRAKEWYEGRPTPLIEDRSPAYISNEEPSIYVALKGLRKRRKARAADQASAA
jgi:deoxycytidylate deaminase